MNHSTHNTAAAQFAANRLASFSTGDIDALVAQYALDAMVVTPNGVLRGRDQIRPMIEGIIGEFARPGVTFNLLGQNAEGPIVAFRWSAETASNSYGLGVETYVLNEAGPAQYQTFAAQARAK